MEKDGWYQDMRVYTSEDNASHFHISARTYNRDSNFSFYVGEKYIAYAGIMAVEIVELQPMETGLITAKVAEKKIQAKEHIKIYGIYFDFDRADIKPES